jgi:hypothetical protein
LIEQAEGEKGKKRNNSVEETGGNERGLDLEMEDQTEDLDTNGRVDLSRDEGDI